MIYHSEAVMYDLVSVECNEHSRAITEYVHNLTFGTANGCV